MRFPSLSQLDREQRAIYSDVDPNDSILVMGPPGTGKTVMAFHRAAVLQKLGVTPSVIMYNKVLSKYVQTKDGPTAEVESCTLHKWVWHWWKRVMGSGLARPPVRPNDEFAHDWQQILLKAIERLGTGTSAKKMDWAHLIIDEGQDFPPDMYQCLHMLAKSLGASLGKSPGLTVFADDNQRLEPGRNSTLYEIRDRLGLGGEGQGRVFRLRKNYRNTRQVAEFARHFYVGLEGGVPELPSRKGDKPTIYTAYGAENLEPVRTLLAAYAQNNPGKEIGVLCASNDLRKKIYNSLSHRLKESGIRVQTYAHADKVEHPAEELAFDEGDVVTILNFRSSKGLEFDAVFIVDPFSSFPAGGSAELEFKMTMYVMSSRARESLHCVLLRHPPRQDLLPPRDSYVLEELD